MKLKKSSLRQIAKALSLISQIGINFVVTIGGCLLLGNFLDGIFHSSPWLLFLFIVLGVLTAFRNLYHMTKEFK